MDNLSLFKGDNYKTLLKAGAITVASVTGGFVLYCLGNVGSLKAGEEEEKEELKKIPLDKLRKIVHKVKDLMVHNMAILHDLRQSYDPDEFKEKDDIQVEEEPVDETEFYKSSSMMSENLENGANKSKTSQKSDGGVNAYKKEYSPIMASSKMISEKLLDMELAKIRQFQFDPKEYYASLEENKDDPELKKDIEFIYQFKKKFDRNELLKVNFGGSINKNYLKIISHIYYFNLRKVQKKFKDDYVDKGYDFQDPREINKIFNEIYKFFLKDTRKEILNFFNVSASDMLSQKILLRIYPYYFSPYHPLRKSYEEMNKEINTLIRKIQSEKCIDELYDDQHPKTILKPSDRIIDFSHMIKENSEKLAEQAGSSGKKTMDLYYQNYKKDEGTD